MSAAPSVLRVFGRLRPEAQLDLDALVVAATGLTVGRARRARSEIPFPSSNDLEIALVQLLEPRGFEHHIRFRHPRTHEGFEYDFWRARDQMAMEVMGYRADDEVYKDLLKFHVHDATRVGMVWVPRWKWISGSRTDTNFRAAMKALAFADSYLDVEALVALVYEWSVADADSAWRLSFTRLDTSFA